MKKILLLATLLSSSALLSGCVISVGDSESGSYHQSDWQKREENNRRHIANLETGMQYQDVTRKMGIADFSELVQTESGSQNRILYYRTQRLSDDGVTTKDECTPLVFVDGQLVGWGYSALNM